MCVYECVRVRVRVCDVTLWKKCRDDIQDAYRILCVSKSHVDWILSKVPGANSHNPIMLFGCFIKACVVDSLYLYAYVLYSIHQLVSLCV